MTRNPTPVQRLLFILLLGIGLIVANFIAGPRTHIAVAGIAMIVVGLGWYYWQGHREN